MSIYDNNHIHPTAIIGDEVVMGCGNSVGPYSIIEGRTEIGNNNIIAPHVIIGCEATDSKHIDTQGKDLKVVIGNNNTIREYSLVEQPCYEERTIIGNNVFLMQGVHVSHDVHIYDHAVLTNLSVLAGIVKVLQGANISMGCTINQYTVLGQYSIVATNAAVMKNVRPFSRYIPNKPTSVNYYAIKKYGFEQHTAEIERYVLEGIEPNNEALRQIIDEFNHWVAQYGHPTYGDCVANDHAK